MRLEPGGAQAGAGRPRQDTGKRQAAWWRSGRAGAWSFVGPPLQRMRVRDLTRILTYSAPSCPAQASSSPRGAGPGWPAPTCRRSASGACSTAACPSKWWGSLVVWRFEMKAAVGAAGWEEVEEGGMGWGQPDVSEQQQWLAGKSHQEVAPASTSTTPACVYCSARTGVQRAGGV